MDVIELKTLTLTIVVPAYNESKTLSAVLDKLAAVDLIHNIQKEIIVVDDCSTDNTREVALQYMEKHPELKIRFFCHETNKGKGAALHTGIRKATGNYLIVQDADLEYDPSEFNLLLQPVVDGFADVVYGSRFMGGNAHRILFFWHTIGNKFLTSLSNMFTNLNLTDMETCYKLFRTDLIQSLVLKEKRFGFEPEVTAKISRIPGIRIYEIGISYYGRTYEEGKKINWKDGLRALYCISKYNLFGKKRRKALAPVSIAPAPELQEEHSEVPGGLAAKTNKQKWDGQLKEAATVRELSLAKDRKAVKDDRMPAKNKKVNGRAVH